MCFVRWPGTVTAQPPQFARYGTIHPTIQLPEMRRFLYAVERTEAECYVPCEERLMSLAVPQVQRGAV